VVVQVQNASAPTSSVAPAPVLEAERIAYIAPDNGKTVLFDMATDGSDVVRLTPKGSNAWFPLWSPSGKVLAFLSDLEKGKTNLFVMQKGSKELKQITFFDDLGEPRDTPHQPPFTWSPRSDQIALIYHQQIVLIDLEKLSHTTVTTVDPNFSILSLDWAPRRDNRYLAFIVHQGEKFHSLWLVNPRLHDRIQLAEIHETAGPLCWTSDANSVAYFWGNNLSEMAYETQRAKAILQEASTEFGPILSYAPVDNNPGILLLAKKDKDDKGYCVALVDKAAADDKDPGTLKYLTAPGAEEAVWSPDASKILYVLQGGLWVMDASGANKKRISLAGVQSPAWGKK